MEYQRRKNNKTARQFFEKTQREWQNRRRQCLLNCLKQVKQDLGQFGGRRDDTGHFRCCAGQQSDEKMFDNTLNWNEFIKKHNKMFIASMKRLRTPATSNEFVRWRGIINTLSSAAKINNSLGADRRYQIFLLELNNSLRSW
tara:strand:+ start:79 stop:504 length:426 start_codon:yes stop_codon:yes gene_type:complete